MSQPRTMFSAYGVELEYMLVDRQSLNVRPIAGELFRAVAGTPTGDFESGALCWSNELVAHVVELKVVEPAATLEVLPELFQRDVREINRLLAPLGARLMPAGMHPWMDPLRETVLWPHDNNEIYAAFNRIFSCQGHGWSNLQSVHLNLPFADDVEFGRLHAAIRLVLPILPALTASSPVVEGRRTGFLDNRLEVYRTNSRKIPSIAGRVIPEPVYTAASYVEQIFERMFVDIAPHDPAGILRHEWLNARGAIARFSRNAIEIRVMDVQECPHADLAICAAVVAVLQGLVNEEPGSLVRQQQVAIDPLERILLATIRDADQAVIADREFLELLGYPVASCRAGDLWRLLIDRQLATGALAATWREPLDLILREGPLARRIVRRLESSADEATALPQVYGALCDCLEQGEMLKSE